MQRSRIAIVEDDPAMLGRFTELFATQPDFDVVAAAATGAAGRACIEHERLNVLLIDLGLPDDDGRALIALCAQRQPQCEIVVVSIFSDDARVMDSLAAGATGYLLKDDLPEEIVQRVRLVRSGGSPVSPSIARRLLKAFHAPADVASNVTATARSAGSTMRNTVREDNAGHGGRSAPSANDAEQPRIAQSVREPVASAAAMVAARLAPPDEALSRRETEILELVAKGCSINEIGQLLHLSAHTVGTHVKNIYRKLAVHSRMEAVYEARSMGLIRD